MLDWLVESPSTVYLLLGTVGLIFLSLWWRTRQRKYAAGAGVTAALAGLYFFLSGFAGETPAQQIERKLHEMSAGVRARDLPRIFEHISAGFRYGSFGKAAFREVSESVIRSREVREIVLWDFEHAVGSSPNSRLVSFHAKPRGNWGGEAFYLVRAEFVLDPDGQWRMKGFKVFNPIVEVDRPIPIPHIGMP